MKRIFVLIFILVLTSAGFSQADPGVLVQAERAFASAAAEKGMKAAFLEFTAPDGILFLPEKVKTTDYWNSRAGTEELLTWAPNYADISSNGIIGYTTGNWEFRAKGKGDNPSGYGQFVTIWQRMPDGKYKFIADIGISHERPAQFSEAVAAPAYPQSANEKNTSAADTANSFFEMAGNNGLNAAYKSYAAENIRGFREGRQPVIGKGKFLSEIKREKGRTAFTKRSVFFGSADIAYITNTYTRTKEDKSVEKGNYLQIWKLVGNRWQIVVDIFKPLTEKQS